MSPIEQNLNSNIEIHKCERPFSYSFSFAYLNSNIEIHKFDNTPTLNKTSFTFKF